MYRLFASDVDDTLLAGDGSLPEQTRRALQLLHENGVTVVLSSGRATASMKPLAASIIEPSDDEYIISFNGGRVVTALSDQVIFEQPIEQPLLELIARYARQEGLHLQGYDADSFLVEDCSATVDQLAKTYGASSGLPWRKVPSLAGALPGGSVKLLGIGEHERLLEHQARLNEICAGQCSIMFSKPHYLEIVKTGVSKGLALTMLADKLGIEIDQCVAMGDSTNDIDMIQTAGLGAAVANARQELKEHADLVLSRTNDQAAIVELMQRCFPEIAAKL